MCVSLNSRLESNNTSKKINQVPAPKSQRETRVQVNEAGASQWEDLMPTLLTNIVTPEESPAGSPSPFWIFI